MMSGVQNIFCCLWNVKEENDDDTETTGSIEKKKKNKGRE